ncbi:MAG: transglutaminase domain-containing protein [Candidatus Marinimicrobia bacterium]|nr:transglutaminase domain-containing protein [Candidatus Neomarinimicrobiota bacterium]
MEKPMTNPKTIQIDEAIKAGHFKEAQNLINQLKTDSATDDLTLVDLRFKEDLMDRIKLDFYKNEAFVREKLAKYYPDLTHEMLANWESTGALEMRVIDGEKRYFYNAVPNLFRIDKEAKMVKEKTDGVKPDELDLFCLKHTGEVLDKFKQTKKNLLNPVKMNITYNVIVDADVVPAGETIRAWLPFPREDNHRQQHVKLKSANVDKFIIAPEEYKQRSIYMEKVAKAGEPTKFEIELSYESMAEYYDLKNMDLGKYDKRSDFYQEFTSEKAPHIVFTDRIKNLTDSLVKDIKDPYEKFVKIYEFIDETTPWASALEYSTFWNIPEYVLEYKHGDCGMQSLLLITMCRYAGIPAKWQSGWMMHPGNLNLHDWAEVYYPAVGWVPVDMSFSLQDSKDKDVRYYYTSGIDTYRLIVNDDISTEFYPQKIWPRSETVDFQRGEVEWRGGNLYFDKWDYNMKVEYED